MKYSTKTRYGIRVMLEIALNATQKESEGILQKDISINQDISFKYLDQIINALKVAKLIINVKGKRSGYILARPAAEITMLDIHNAFEPGINVVDCVLNGGACKRSVHCASRHFWGTLNQAINNTFSDYTLADMVKKQLLIDKKV